MNDDLEGILAEVLSEIGYEGNQVVFVQKFVALCHYRACWNLVGRLSSEEQVEIQKKTPHGASPNMILSSLRQWYSDQDYLQALGEATGQAFGRCFGEMIGMMSDAKQEKVKLLLSRFV